MNRQASVGAGSITGSEAGRLSEADPSLASWLEDTSQSVRETLAVSSTKSLQATEPAAPLAPQRLRRMDLKRMRRNLGQSWLTNRFTAAPAIERDFQGYLMHCQLRSATRRLALFGSALLLYGAGGLLVVNVWPGAASDEATRLLLEAHVALAADGGAALERRMGAELGAGAAAATFLAGVVLLAGWGLLQAPALRRPRRWWLVVAGAYLLALQVFEWLLLSSAAWYDRQLGALCGLDGNASCDGGLELSLLRQRAWERAESARSTTLLAFCALVSLNSCLDYCHVLCCAALGVASYLAAELAAAAMADDGGGVPVQRLMLAVAFAVAAVYGARRTNRFERQIFLQTEALVSEVDEKADLIAGRRSQVRALLTNPASALRRW